MQRIVRRRNMRLLKLNFWGRYVNVTLSFSYSRPKETAAQQLRQATVNGLKQAVVSNKKKGSK